MFNHGVRDVLEQLKENGNPEAIFNVNYVTAFSVVVKEAEEANLSPTVHQLFTNLSEQSKILIMRIGEQKMSAKELQLVTDCSPKSKQLFMKQFILPNLENGLLAMTYPERVHHPRQKYYLTKKGLEMLKKLQDS